MRRATSCTQVSMTRTQRKKRTVWFVFLFVGAVYASQIAQLRLRAFARNTSCCICSLCPLCSISANAVRLRLSSLVVYRDLSNSDCYRRSIACNGRCRPNKCKAMLCANFLHTSSSFGDRAQKKNTSRLTRVIFMVRSPRLELGRCNHTPLKRTRLPIPP